MKCIIKITILSILFLSFSCSSKKTEHKVTTTQTVQTEANSTNDSVNSAAEVGKAPMTKTTVVKKEVKEEAEDSGGDFGILGTTVSVIGEIIALPFRLVAGIIDFIF